MEATMIAKRRICMVLALSGLAPAPAWATPRKVVKVEDVNALYEAVNDPTRHDTEVRIAGGRTYRLGMRKLLPNGKSLARPNEGRLVLQHGMTLVGDNNYLLVNGRPTPRDASGEVFADPASETIFDGSDLLGGTQGPGGTAGIVRIGRGNTVRGLTIRSNPDAVASIAVDQLDPGGMSAEVTDCTLEAGAGGGRRGLMIPEAFADFDGTSSTVVVERNVVRHHRVQFGFGVQAVRVGASDLSVAVHLDHNVIYDNNIGFFLANLSVTGTTTTASSTANVLRGNDDGIVILGGRDFGFAIGSLGNVTELTSTDDEITEGLFDAVFAIAALRDDSLAPESSNNVVSITMSGAQLTSATGPQNGEGAYGSRLDFDVYGALSNFYPDQGAGVNNLLELLLTGCRASPVAGEAVYVHGLDADVPEPTNRVVFVGGAGALAGNNPDVPVVVLPP
jgi:hypothetical protein